MAGHLLSLPSFVTPQFQEFFRLGRVLRTTLPTAQGVVVHLFVVYGYQGAEEDAEKLRLTDRLLQAVLAEAQVICIGQPMIIAGDLNADPAVIPCLAKGIAAGRYVDLALAHSLGAGLAPDYTFKGIRNNGLTQSRWDTLIRYWGVVCRHGPCGLISSLHPWDNWVPPDLHGFYRWVIDSLEVLNGFVRQVVISRRDEGIRRWNRWLREDLSSRPYAWLRPDFVPPSPFLVVKDPPTQSSQIIVEPHLIDAEFRKAWMPYFCRSGHPVVSPEQFLDFIGHFLPQENVLDLPRITGRDLQEVARAKQSTAGGLDGWAWNEVKALPLPWFSGLAILLELVASTGSWPQGLLDAYIAMIPKADGDSTPLGQRPLSVLPVVYRLWASLRLGHLREWLEGWLPKSV